MKLLTLLLSLNAMAGISEYGDYYLESDRAHYINPAKLTEMPDQIYAMSKAEIGYKNDDYLIAATKKKIIGAYLFSDMIGLEGFISALNGQGIESYGLTLGTNLSGNYSFYMGFTDSQGGDFLPKVGFTLDAYKGVLFAEYIGQIVTVPSYEFKVGYGRTFGEYFFGDLTYKQVNENDRSLLATAGAKTFVLEKVAGLAAVSKELFFKGDLKIIAGLEWYATNHVEFSLSHDLTAFSKSSPKYKDFDIKAAVKYMF